MRWVSLPLTVTISWVLLLTGTDPVCLHQKVSWLPTMVFSYSISSLISQDHHKVCTVLHLTLHACPDLMKNYFFGDIWVVEWIFLCSVADLLLSNKPLLNKLTSFVTMVRDTLCSEKGNDERTSRYHIVVSLCLHLVCSCRRVLLVGGCV